MWSPAGSIVNLGLGPGEVLPAQLRSELEEAFGADLAAVRIHDGPMAAEVARRQEAEAFAAGPHIVFGRGALRPDAPRGRELLSHEVVHVLQQTGRRASDGRLRATNPSGVGEVQRWEVQLPATEDQPSPAWVRGLAERHAAAAADSEDAAAILDMQELLLLRFSLARGGTRTVAELFDGFVDGVTEGEFNTASVPVRAYLFDAMKFMGLHRGAAYLLWRLPYLRTWRYHDTFFRYFQTHYDRVDLVPGMVAGTAYDRELDAYVDQFMAWVLDANAGFVSDADRWHGRYDRTVGATASDAIEASNERVALLCLAFRMLDFWLREQVAGHDDASLPPALRTYGLAEQWLRRDTSAIDAYIRGLFDLFLERLTPRLRRVLAAFEPSVSLGNTLQRVAGETPAELQAWRPASTPGAPTDESFAQMLTAVDAPWRAMLSGEANDQGTLQLPQEGTLLARLTDWLEAVDGGLNAMSAAVMSRMTDHVAGEAAPSDELIRLATALWLFFLIAQRQRGTLDADYIDGLLAGRLWLARETILLGQIYPDVAQLRIWSQLAQRVVAGRDTQTPMYVLLLTDWVPTDAPLSRLASDWAIGLSVGERSVPIELIVRLYRRLEEMTSLQQLEQLLQTPDVDFSSAETHPVTRAAAMARQVRPRRWVVENTMVVSNPDAEGPMPNPQTLLERSAKTQHQLRPPQGESDGRSPERQPRPGSMFAYPITWSDSVRHQMYAWELPDLRPLLRDMLTALPGHITSDPGGDWSSWLAALVSSTDAEQATGSALASYDRVLARRRLRLNRIMARLNRLRLQQSLATQLASARENYAGNNPTTWIPAEQILSRIHTAAEDFRLRTASAGRSTTMRGAYQRLAREQSALLLLSLGEPLIYLLDQRRSMRFIEPYHRLLTDALATLDTSQARLAAVDMLPESERARAAEGIASQLPGFRALLTRMESWVDEWQMSFGIQARSVSVEVPIEREEGEERGADEEQETRTEMQLALSGIRNDEPLLEGQPFVYHGIQYTILDVATAFRHNPGLGARLPGGQRQFPARFESAAGGSNPILFTYRTQRAGESGYQDHTVRASDHQRLEELAEVIEMSSLHKRLGHLADALESYGEALRAAMELIPVFGDIAGTVTNIIEFIASGEFEELKRALSEDPIGTLERFVELLRPDGLSADRIWSYFLWGRANPFEALQGSQRTPRTPPRRRSRGNGIRRLMGIVRRFITLARPILGAFGRVRDLVQDKVAYVRGTVLTNRPLFMVLRFTYEHLELLETALTAAANPTETIAQVRDDLSGSIIELVRTIEAFELPSQLVPMSDLVGAIVDGVIEMMPQRVELAYDVLSVTGLTELLFEHIGHALSGTAMDPNTYWRSEVLPLVDDRFHELKVDLLRGVYGVLREAGFPIDPPGLERHGTARGDFDEEEEDTEAAPFGDDPLEGASVGRAFSSVATPLPPHVRAVSESRFGHDLSHVRLHRGAETDAVLGAVSADGLTSGSHVAWPSSTPLGGPVLDHELAHVLQHSGPRPLVSPGHSEAPISPHRGRGLLWSPTAEAGADRMARDASGRHGVDVTTHGGGGVRPSFTRAAALDFLRHATDRRTAETDIIQAIRGGIGTSLSGPDHPAPGQVLDSLESQLRRGDFQVAARFSRLERPLRDYFRRWTLRRRANVEAVLGDLAIRRVNHRGTPPTHSEYFSSTQFKRAVQVYFLLELGFALDFDITDARDARHWRSNQAYTATPAAEDHR
ncbi:MAG: DUF4157 domain-containing protein, partial [Myxococcales bacterium]|nr:DUF4157 domain-containing protein [Myxococcales bacterium]